MKAWDGNVYTIDVYKVSNGTFFGAYLTQYVLLASSQSEALDKARATAKEMFPGVDIIATPNFN